MLLLYSEEAYHASHSHCPWDASFSLFAFCPCNHKRKDSKTHIEGGARAQVSEPQDHLHQGARHE